MSSLLLSGSPSKTSLQIVSVQGAVSVIVVIFISEPNLLIWGTPASCHFSLIFRHLSSKKGKRIYENLAKEDMRIWPKRI